MRTFQGARKTFISLAIFFIAAGIFQIPDSYGAVYKYTDKNGTECYTDSIQAVPPEYRKKAVLVSEGSKPEKKPAAQVPEDKGGATPDGQEGRVSKFIRGLKELATGPRSVEAGAAVVVFLLLFAFAGKIGALLGFKDIGSIFRILLVLLLLVYLFSLYSRRVEDAATGIKDEIQDIKKQFDGKEEKTQKTFKEAPDETKK